MTDLAGAGERIRIPFLNVPTFAIDVHKGFCLHFDPPDLLRR